MGYHRLMRVYIDPFCLTDGADVYVYVGNLGPRFQDATELALTGSYNTTNLDIHYSGSQTSNTDVYYEYASLPFPQLESGHSVGLTHGDQASPTASNLDANLGCLRTPLRRSSPYYALGSHNVGQINGEY